MTEDVFVTGASGFVGANLTRKLLEQGHRVHVLLRPDHDPWRLSGLREDLVEHPGDLLDPGSVLDAMKVASPRWVFHLGVFGAYPHQSDADRMIGTNIRGTAAVLDAALRTGAESVVNTGSSSEYGSKRRAAAEDEPLEPTSVYGVTKAAATMYCRHIAERRGVWIPTLRLYSVYGPYEEPSRLWPTLVLHALRGGLPPLADSRTARDFVHVDDVVRAYLIAARARQDDRGRVYNVASGVQTTLGELVELTIEELDVEATPGWASMASRDWDTDVWVGDITRITSELSWTPQRDVREGLRSLTRWFLSHEELRGLYEDRLGIGQTRPGDRGA